MSAYLDSQRNWGERNGGVSDPRLVRRVEHLPARPNTPDEITAAKRQVTSRSHGRRDLATLLAMIFPPVLEAA